ncbi:MAG TPA: hypothetical protein VFU12_15075 [Glycomyces sp.]|nr:hypothetical protein [Glycomyces sp.]
MKHIKVHFVGGQFVEFTLSEEGTASLYWALEEGRPVHVEEKGRKTSIFPQNITIVEVKS